MRKNRSSESGAFNLRVFLAFILFSIGASLAVARSSMSNSYRAQPFCLIKVRAVATAATRSRRRARQTFSRQRPSSTTNALAASQRSSSIATRSHLGNSAVPGHQIPHRVRRGTLPTNQRRKALSRRDTAISTSPTMSNRRSAFRPISRQPRRSSQVARGAATAIRPSARSRTRSTSSTSRSIISQ